MSPLRVYRIDNSRNRKACANHWTFELEKSDVTAGTQQHDKTGLQLEASLPHWCVLNWKQFLIVSAFAITFLWSNYVPVPAATWQDLNHGKSVVANGLFDTRLADTSTLPLSEGIRSFRVGTISKWFLFQIFQLGGIELLSFLHAIIQSIFCAAWAWLLSRTTGRWWTALIPFLLCFLPLQAPGITTFTIAQVCLVAILISVCGKKFYNPREEYEIQISKLPVSRWLMIIIAMVVWTNADPSFVLGWALLAAVMLGRVLATVAGGLENSFADRELRSRIVLLEIAILISCMTPAGISLWKAMLWTPDNPIWLQLGGWQPLVFVGWHGAVVVCLILTWIICSRKTEKIKPWQWIIPLMGLAVVAFNSTMLSLVTLPILWCSLSMLPFNAREFSTPNPAITSSNDSPTLKFGLTLACGLMLWLAFAFSPCSQFVLGGKGRSPDQLLGSNSPHSAFTAIESSLSNGKSRTFAWVPRYWSDHLLTQNDSISVFASSDPHTIPAQANADYDVIFNGQHGWQKLLNRYAIDVLLVDTKIQTRLMHNLRAKPGPWRLVHEDSITAVWNRSQPDAN
jgi:hypothetical protein